MKMREQIAQLLRENAVLKEMNDRQALDIQRLNSSIQEKMITALLSATNSMQECTKVVTELTEERVVLRQEIANLNEVLKQKTVPALLSASTAVQASTKLLQEVEAKAKEGR